MARGGSITDYVLMALFLFLVMLFLHRRGYIGHSEVPVRSNKQQLRQKQHQQSHLVREEESEEHVVISDDLGIKRITGELLDEQEEPATERVVDPRLKRITDSREEACQQEKYHITDPISIIIDFFDYQFYDMKITLGSVVLNTDPGLIKEIIVIDDGSTLDYIIEDCKKFLKGIPNVRKVRNEQKTGATAVRRQGRRLATASVLVFMDVNVVCNEGWLPPLLQLLATHKDVIAVPHADLIHDPLTYQYQAVKPGLVTTFSWSLIIRMTRLKDERTNPTAAIRSPMLRGNVFAVSAKSLENLDFYDQAFGDTVGANMELALRYWMCGSGVRVAPCSRVGVLNLHDTYRLTNHSHVTRLAEVWMGKRKELVYRNAGISGPARGVSQWNIEAAVQKYQGLNCKDFDWYLANAAANMVAPSSEAEKFGLIKSGTSRCAMVAADSRLDLGSCSMAEFDAYPSAMLFEMDREGRVRCDEKCLMVKSSGYVVAADCRTKDDTQRWKYEHHTFKNQWSGSCFMHVTDPDKNTDKRQIVMAQNCDSDKSKDKQFVSFEFISV